MSNSAPAAAPEPVNYCTPASIQLVLGPPRAPLARNPATPTPASGESGGISGNRYHGCGCRPADAASARCGQHPCRIRPCRSPSAQGRRVVHGSGFFCCSLQQHAAGSPSCGVPCTPWPISQASGFSGSLYTAPPQITFQGGGCAEPTAIAAIGPGGAINTIYLTSLGGGCRRRLSSTSLRPRLQVARRQRLSRWFPTAP